MKPPATYAEWSDCLDRLLGGLDDAGCASDIDAGTLDWSAGVAPKFAARIHETFDERLRRCGHRLSRGLAVSCDEAGVLRALLDCRRTLTTLHAIAGARPFPTELRQHLQTLLRDFAARAMSSLESSARDDRTGRTQSLLQHNSLLRFDAAASSAVPPSAATATAPRHRTILV
jgi:hypothetical protein